MCIRDRAERGVECAWNILQSALWRLRRSLAAKLIQGGGGGQPHFASAGGKNTDGLNAAIDKVVELAKL